MRLAPVVLYAAALAAPLGCSSPVPATPDTSWVVNFSGGGANCNLSNSVGKVGDVTAGTIQQRVSDGMASATVTCTVAPSGSSFQVSAQASQNGYSLTVFIPQIDLNSVMSNPAVGSVSYESSSTINSYSSNMCNFYFINPSASGNGQGVSAGKIWAAFDCPEITYGQSSPPSVCSLSESYLAFENCATM